MVQTSPQCNSKAFSFKGVKCAFRQDTSIRGFGRGGRMTKTATLSPEARREVIRIVNPNSLAAQGLSLPPLRDGGPVAATAKPVASRSMDPFAYVGDLNPQLGKYLRPQSAFQWWTLPYLSAITPQYVQQVLIGALAGNHVPAWQLFDLMIDSNPEIAACVGEYVDGICSKKLIIEPYHEEDEQPSSNAIRNQKIVSAALRNMQPDPATDENALRACIRDIAFGRFFGQSVQEIDFYEESGGLHTVNINKIGDIVAPRCTFWVHPVCYAFDITGRLGLRIPTEELREVSKSSKSWKPGQLPSDFGLANGLSYSGYTGSPRPASLTAFPKNQFLISTVKAKTGSALAASCLRSLSAWWVFENFAADYAMDLAQIFGIPFRVGYYQSGTSEPDKAFVRDMLQNMGSRGWALLPDSVKLDFEKAMENGSASPQGFLIKLCQEQYRKVILRQTMTGSGHGGAAQGSKGGMSTEAEVKDKCIQSGADFACNVLRDQFARSILLLNVGDDSELPFIRLAEEQEGTLEEMERDQIGATIIDLGENYFRKKYNYPKPSAGEKIAGKTPAPGPTGPSSAPASGGAGKTAAAANEQNVAGTELDAGDVSGHPFHGNQWTDSSFTAATQPLRPKRLIGDEVAFRKSDGTVQRGYLGFRTTSQEDIVKGEVSKAPQSKQRANLGGLSKKEYRDAVDRKASYEVNHAELQDVAGRPGVKMLTRTGEKSILPASQIRMPKDGFKNRDVLDAASPEIADRQSAIENSVAGALADAIAPLVNYLKSGLKIEDPAAQQEFFQRAITKWPQLTEPLKHDTGVGEKLEPHLVENFIAGLTAKSTGDKSLEAGDVPGHEFHGNQWSDQVGQIRDVMSGKKDESAYAPVSADTAAKIKAATGQDVTGYKHFIDHEAMVHIARTHGPGFEKESNQVPLAKEDFEKIPQIVNNPDKVEKGATTGRGLPSVKYTKRFNGTTYYVEEQWSGEKVLAAKTMYKVKTEAPGNSATPKGGGSHTSGTSGAPKT